MGAIYKKIKGQSIYLHSFSASLLKQHKQINNIWSSPADKMKEIFDNAIKKHNEKLDDICTKTFEELDITCTKTFTELGLHSISLASGYSICISTDILSHLYETL